MSKAKSKATKICKMHVLYIHNLNANTKEMIFMWAPMCAFNLLYVHFPICSLTVQYPSVCEYVRERQRMKSMRDRKDETSK